MVKPTVKMSDSSKSLITVPCDVDKIDCERCPTVNNSVFTFFCNVGENWLWKMPDLLITLFSLCPAMVVRTDYERCLTVIIVSCNIGETEGCLWKLHNSLSPGPVMLIRFDCERSDWFDCLAYDCSENWLWLWKTSEEMNSTSAWVFVCVFLHNVSSFKLVSHSVSISHCILWLSFFFLFSLV